MGTSTCQARAVNRAAAVRVKYVDEGGGGLATYRTLLQSACDEGDGPSCLEKIRTDCGLSAHSMPTSQSPLCQGMHARARSLSNAGCQAGCQPDCAALGQLLIAADQGHEGLSLINRACAANDIEACVALGDAHMNNTYGKLNEALVAYDKACGLGSAYACYTLAPLLYNVNSDKKQLNVLYDRACSLGYASACKRASEASNESGQLQVVATKTPAPSSDRLSILRSYHVGRTREERFCADIREGWEMKDPWENAVTVLGISASETDRTYKVGMWPPGTQGRMYQPPGSPPGLEESVAKAQRGMATFLEDEQKGCSPVGITVNGQSIEAKELCALRFRRGLLHTTSCGDVR